MLVIKYSWPIFHSVFKKYDNLNNSIQENITGIRVVKSFVREDHEREKFKKASDDVADGFTRAEKILALNSPIMQFCFNALMLMVCFFGSRLIITTNEAALDIAGFSALLTYGAQILMSLMMVSMIIVMLAMSIESANRLCEVLREKSDIAEPECPITEVRDGSVLFDKVSFSYKATADKKALADINLFIAPGETVTATVTVANTGSRPGTAVPQLYIRDCFSSTVKPERRLCGFARVDLLPGEEKTVQIPIGPKSMRTLGRDYIWRVEPGRFRVYLNENAAESWQECSFIVK